MADSEKSTSSSTPLGWVFLSGILGLFAVGTPVLNNSAGKKDAAKQPEPAPFKMSSKDPLKPVFDFYATHDGKWDPEADLRNRLHNFDVEFLIATVPDPIDSPYGHAFDQVVDAIQRAVEKKDGYFLDRAWLPWEVDKKHKTAKPDEEATNSRESYPGLLLFRRSKQMSRRIERPGLCIVFLVGETPLSGLHKRAFTRALRMMAAAGHPATEPVRVIGPYFSGSQTSLQFVAGDWWAGAARPASQLLGYPVPWLFERPSYKFDVITGNASAIRKKDYFDLDPDGRDGHVHWQPDKFTINSTVVPTRLIISAMLRYLARRDGCEATEPILTRSGQRLPGKVALLTETNTAFGKMFDAIGEEEDLVQLRFPLHISQVKNEYTEAFRKQDEQNGLKPGNLPLPTSLEDANPASEGVPAQGGATTTTINAQVLANILATIAREECRYVGVISSDARDKLFLIRLIREHCPDVHVFVTDADQLLLHPDYRYYMRGVVVGSTYPLVGQNQRWVDPGSKERVLFPTVGAQGYYNAVLMHLGRHKQLLEYGPPRFASLERSPDGDSANLQRPPIWISVVTPNGSFAPVQVFTEYDDAGGTMRLSPETPSALERSSLSYPGAMFPLGIGLLSFWIYLVYQALMNRSSRMFWEPAAESAEFSLHQLCFRNLLLGSQAVLAMLVLALTATHGHVNGYGSWWMAPLTGLSALLLAGFLAGMLKPLCWPPSRARQMAQWLKPRQAGQRTGLEARQNRSIEVWCWAIINVVLAIVVVGCVALFLGRFWAFGGPTRRTLFFIRAVDLTSGLSPLTPLFFMCMGFAAWSYYQLRRAHHIDRYVVPPPFPAGVGETSQDGAFNRINELDRAVQEEVRHQSVALRHGKAVALTALGLLALGLAVWLQSLPTIEGWSWDGLFFAGFSGLYALSVLILVRLFHLWRQTKKLLDAVALVPMMRAFARLPAKVTDVFGKYLFTQRPRLEHLQLPLHQLRLLSEEVARAPDAPAELQELGAITTALERRLQEGLSHAPGKSSAQRAERDLRGKLSAVAASCLSALAPRWKTLPLEEAYGQGGGIDKADPPAADAAEPAWVALAENVVAAQIIIYVSQFFAQLRSLVVAALVCTSLLLLAATSYPFHPERILLVCLLGLSAAGLGGIMYVLIEMNRDEVVSRILKTTPGKLSLDSGFIGTFAGYVVPAIGLVAAQLSGSFRWLLEPLLHVMK